MPKRKDMRYWNIPVTPKLDDRVEKLVKEGYHISKSELIRYAVIQYTRHLEAQSKR